MSSRGRSAIGWFMLSEADRAASARLLEQSDAEGTRDELGFGVIHFAYSDRFFPGTSVQHGRLRYIFFLTWTYRELIEGSAGKPFPAPTLADIERRTANRLIKSATQLQNSGISGWSRYAAKRDPVVPASQIYWNALKTWGLLNPDDRTGKPPAQSELHRKWPSLLEYEDSGDDGKPATAPVFDDSIPSAPDGWAKASAALHFDLTPDEAIYIKEKWRAMTSPGLAQPPLLSRLADAGIHGVSMWHDSVLSLANEAERASLKRSKQAASLVCIGRAVHAALIERERNRDLALESDVHLEILEVMRKKHRTRACALDLTVMRKNDVRMDDDLFELLEAFQLWAQNGGPIQLLFEQVRNREYALKDDLAYLVSAKRREQWDKGQAFPLEYRWPIVDRLLSDLAKSS